MTASTSPKDFWHCVGFIPVREVWSEAWACGVVFLIIYGVFLIFQLPLAFATKVIGVPGKVIDYLAAFVLIVWALRDRKYIFSQLEKIFGELKDAASWELVLFAMLIAAGLASSKWLPGWLSTGVWTGLIFLMMFIDRLDRLGEEYAPKLAEPEMGTQKN